MNGILCNPSETIFSANGMTELVRGEEQDLVEKVTPIVHDRSVALDLRHVERIDAAGIAALISLYGRAHDAGHEFRITNVSPRVAEILALVGLDRILLSQNAVQNSHSAGRFERSAA